ncbi:methyltransferase regulatory domain-containing protein [Campylobacter majalis]|uniref:methyltransferase regulatory domain-containing protein n=1 Tax=Campylobacter majalis TaxID=2790656 RepID=UPI003D69F2B2
MNEISNSDIISQTQSSYDEYGYISSAFNFTSPLRLEAIGRFLSLSPIRASDAKILEIGSSYGGNIIPFALHNPNATIVGIDLSQVQVDAGNEIINKIGLKNIKLIQKDITQSDEILSSYGGGFDYIICHGVYSWVPKNVQDAILSTIKNHMSPNGIAFVSYNTYPGWKYIEVIKDFMFFASRKFQDPAQKLKASLDALQTYKATLQNLDTLEGKMCLKWIDHVLSYTKTKHGSSYIIHEYLEAINEPFYFTNFAQNLQKYNLEYLSDSDLNDILQAQTGNEQADEYAKQNNLDRIEQEQFIDFCTQRTFRQSLIVHQDVYNNAKRDIGVNEVSKLYLIDYFKKDKATYLNLENRQMGDTYAWLYEMFNENFPKSMSLAEILNSIPSQNKLAAYLGFIHILSNHSTFMPKPYECIRYEVGKTRLKPAVKEYLKYFLHNENPLIIPANEYNYTWHATKLEFYTALKFDGKNSMLDIKNSVEKYIKTNKIQPKTQDDKEIKGAKALNEYLINYVFDIENKLAQMYFFEKIYI